MRAAISFPFATTEAQCTVLRALLREYKPKAVHTGDTLANTWVANLPTELFFHARPIDAADASDYLIGLADNYTTLPAPILYARFSDMPLVIIYPNGKFVREGKWPKELA